MLNDQTDSLVRPQMARPSDCETPGIALLEAALAGARPVVTRHGGTQEYFGINGEYFNPVNPKSLKRAIVQAWERGRLTPYEASSYARFTWHWTAELTVNAYQIAINQKTGTLNR
jgi:glycosyltransferase involved in cell wall biosynthesis